MWGVDRPEGIDPHASTYHRIDDIMFWLYILVIACACTQFILIIRYFMRIKGHFNRLQQEISDRYAKEAGDDAAT